MELHKENKEYQWEHSMTYHLKYHSQKGKLEREHTAEVKVRVLSLSSYSKQHLYSLNQCPRYFNSHIKYSNTEIRDGCFPISSHETLIATQTSLLFLHGKRPFVYPLSETSWLAGNTSSIVRTGTEQKVRKFIHYSSIKYHCLPRCRYSSTAHCIFSSTLSTCLYSILIMMLFYTLFAR